MTQNRDIAATISQLQRPSEDLLEVPAYEAPRRSSSLRLGLAVESMRHHMTDEGWKLFQSLQVAEYRLAGYGINTPLDGGGELRDATDVSAMINRLCPGTVVMQDKREWDVETNDFREPRARFLNVQSLKHREDIFKVTVLKDAHQRPRYHRDSADEIGCHAWIVYYHPAIVHHVAPYTRPQHLVRTYHCVDPELVPAMDPHRPRAGSLLSGAISGAYPLRQALVQARAYLPHTTYLPHPGYHRLGCATPHFLQQLANYKVAICTSSVYGYALRKIIEATAAGCIVVTDLPTDEVLPEIDANLVRVSPRISPRKLAEILSRLYDAYDHNIQCDLAKAATQYYSYQAVGMRLAHDIERLRVHYHDHDAVPAVQQEPAGEDAEKQQPSG